MLTHRLDKTCRKANGNILYGFMWIVFTCLPLLYDSIIWDSENSILKILQRKMRHVINLIYFQLIRLDNLFAYWNVKSQMFYVNNYDESLVSKFLMCFFGITFFWYHILHKVLFIVVYLLYCSQWSFLRKTPLAEFTEIYEYMWL